MANTGSGENFTESTYTADNLELGNKSKKKKEPKRILHFSDGILEEYSSDESDEEKPPPKLPVNPHKLNWGRWCLHYISTAARMSLAAADFCGEKLAWFFGITTPKYRYEIEEYKRMAKEIEEEKARDQKLYEEAQGLSTIDIQVMDSKKPQAANYGAGDSGEHKKY